MTNKFKGKKIFISGGNGVIGNELVAKLAKAGAIIFVGDLKPRPDNWPKNIIYRQGDLNYITKAELDNFGAEYFFHLAATFERSTESYEFWQENFWHNVRLSNYLMSLFKDSRTLKKVIFCSSYLIYNPELYNFNQPAKAARRLKETDPIYPRNLTGVAKLNHEIELKFLEEFRGRQYSSVCPRIFRSYGKNSRDIISRWIRALLKGETLTVYRSEGMFDYIFAGEVAEGLIRLAANGKAKGIYNLGNDNARRVSEVLAILKKHFPKLKYKEVKSNISFEASQANMDNFYKTIGWKPRLQLEQAIPQMIAYEKKHNFNQEESPEFNVLITSISKKIPMIKAVRQAADKINKQIKIFGADADTNCLGRYFVDEFWKMPAPNKLKVGQIIAYCRKNNIKVIIPSRDGELGFWSNLKPSLLKDGIAVMVSDKAGIDICLDKLRFSQHLIKFGYPAIMTMQNIDKLATKTYAVKERFGAGSMGQALNVSNNQALAFAKKLKQPIFQPFIAGQEYTVDVYLQKNGRAKGAIVRSRDLVKNGESQITSIVEHDRLSSLAIKIAEKLKLYGHINFQALEDKKKNLYVIEANCRFGGASTISLAAGLDSFYWFLLEAGGTEISSYPFFKSKTKLKQIRYPSDLIINNK